MEKNLERMEAAIDRLERVTEAQETLFKINLRKMQAEGAEAGDADLLIHLGKNWLGQHD